MKSYCCDAILLRVRDYGDADRMVTLFSRDYGKVVAIARGARRPRNRLAASTQVFCWGEYLLFHGSRLDTVNQCEIKDSFRGLHEDLDKMVYASYMVELIDELVPERDKNERLYDLLLQVLPLLTQRNPRILSVLFTVQCLLFAGLCPMLTQCSGCGTVVQEPQAFDISLGGIVCNGCRTSSAIPVSAEDLKWLAFFNQYSVADPQAFSISGRVLARLEALLEQYVGFCLDKPLKSIEFLHTLHK